MIKYTVILIPDYCNTTVIFPLIDLTSEGNQNFTLRNCFLELQEHRQVNILTSTISLSTYNVMCKALLFHTITTLKARSRLIGC